MAKCKECEREAGEYTFCSIECACYAGCFSVKTGMDEKKLEAYLKDKNG